MPPLLCLMLSSSPTPIFSWFWKPALVLVSVGNKVGKCWPPPSLIAMPHREKQRALHWGSVAVLTLRPTYCFMASDAWSGRSGSKLSSPGTWPIRSAVPLSKSTAALVQKSAPAKPVHENANQEDCARQVTLAAQYGGDRPACAPPPPPPGPQLLQRGKRKEEGGGCDQREGCARCRRGGRRVKQQQQQSGTFLSVFFTSGHLAGEESGLSRPRRKARAEAVVDPNGPAARRTQACMTSSRSVPPPPFQRRTATPPGHTAPFSAKSVTAEKCTTTTARFGRRRGAQAGVFPLRTARQPCCHGAPVVAPIQRGGRQATSCGSFSLAAGIARTGYSHCCRMGRSGPTCVVVAATALCARCIGAETL